MLWHGSRTRRDPSRLPFMMERTFQTDPTLYPRVVRLLERVFGAWFGKCLAQATEHGLNWRAASRPFVVEANDRVVAHAGILELPLVLGGEPHVVAGLHAVATAPEHRRQGHMRRVIEAALAYCEERYETILLTTAQPALYEPFGFVVREEHLFSCEVSASGAQGHMRPVDWWRAEDRQRVHDLLRRRAPVSTHLGVLQERDVFLFNSALTHNLYVIEPLGALVWLTRQHTTVRLHDLVAEKIPRLEVLLAHIGGPIERVETLFSPDRLGGTFDARPQRFDGDEYLMVRGPFLPDDVPITLPRSARC